MTGERKPVRRALVSVWDKAGLEELAAVLRQHDVEVVSTGSTAQRVESMGTPVTAVEELTGFPECLDGRVKTLHPKVHAGLLADTRLDSHRQQLEELDVEPFDLLVSNLYPFSATVASGASVSECIEQIDIGGPAMVRAAAKNHANVAVITSPSDYHLVASALAAGGFTLQQRQLLAAKAYADIAEYDVAVARWTAETLVSQAEAEPAAAIEPEVIEPEAAEPEAPVWPEFAGTALRRASVLRYGENPHQAAALYLDPHGTPGLAGAERLGGKPMSYNNYVDADSAWRTVHDFNAHLSGATYAVAIIKHANPCGIAVSATSVADAHAKAHACDPVSAYGGVIAVNSQVDVELAQQLEGIFTEVIVAPAYSDEALAILTAKKNLRVLRAPAYRPEPIEIRQVSGGFLMQTRDRYQAAGDDPATWSLATGEAVDEHTMADLEFAWFAVRAVKSNAILLAKDGATVGVGMGQVNRVDSSRLAVARAGERVAGSVAASDAFFPFPDALQVLIDAGVRAVVQPGGSIRDELVIAAAKDAGITMYFTGTRHFAH